MAIKIEMPIGTRKELDVIPQGVSITRTVGAKYVYIRDDSGMWSVRIDNLDGRISVTRTDGD